MGLEDDEPDAPTQDPLQGLKEEIVATYNKGIEEVQNAIPPIEIDFIPTYDGFFEYQDIVRNIMGDEWENDPLWWTDQVKRDWETMQYRVREQIDESQRRQMGGDDEGGRQGYIGFDKLGELRLITFEQFILESNAGQFREDRFYCDKGRKWLNRVKEKLASYGYLHVRKIIIEGQYLLEVSKNEMESHTNESR